MAEVRTNPLPIGRYWIDVSDSPKGPTVDDFNAWTQANTSKVRVETTEETPPQHGNPRRVFVIFNVTAPVFFPAANFGFPEVAPSNVHTEQDVFGAPSPDEGLKLPTFGDLTGALGGLPLVLIVLLVLAASREGGNRRAAAA